MSSSILLSVLDIYLDTENPRHDPIYEQPKIIAHLLKDERVKNLAKHITLHGVNPLDQIGVIKDEEENYVVVEGNRRLCALLLLNDPEKAPSGDVPTFKRLAANGAKTPTSINCVLFDDDDEANIWMDIRHSGEQDGLGVRGWDAKQKTRHKSKTKKKDQNALALALLDYAASKEFITVSDSKNVITTMTRYLGNPFIRDTFGIVSSRSEHEVKINVTCEEFNVVLNQFCADLIDVSNDLVSSRSTKEDWLAYGRKLIEEGVAPRLRTEPHELSTCLTQPSPRHHDNTQDHLGTNNKSDFTDTAQPSTEPVKNQGSAVPQQLDNSPPSNNRGNNNPDSRKYIVSSDFKPTVNNKILRRALEELRNIPVDDRPLAVSLVTRAFLENIYMLFLENSTGNYQAQPTHIVIGKAIKQIELDNTLGKQEINALAALRRVQSNERNVLSPKTLGANAHAGIYPSATELKREFDNVSEIIKYMLKRI